MGMGAAGLGWRSSTGDERSSPCPQAPWPALSVWGSTAVLFLNIGIFYAIVATYLISK